MNAHDILREEKKKQHVHIVSEEELKEIEAVPPTTESFFQESQSIVLVVLEFPDGSLRVVKVCRFNNAEAFQVSVSMLFSKTMERLMNKACPKRNRLS